MDQVLHTTAFHVVFRTEQYITAYFDCFRQNIGMFVFYHICILNRRLFYVLLPCSEYIWMKLLISLRI